MRASSLPLLTKCSGSAVLPRDESKSEKAEEGANWGSMVHQWKETGKVEQPRESDRQVSKRVLNAFAKAVKLSGVDRTALWPVGGKHEQKVFVRVDGQRVVSLEKPDGDADGWVSGTDDFHYWLEPFEAGGKPELWVDDLKTGKWYPHPTEPGVNRYPQDVRSPQLRLYALAICVALDYDGPVHISLTHWPRLPLAMRHAQPVRYWDQVDSSFLRGEFWASLEVLYTTTRLNQRLLDADAPEMLILNPGDHCRFCPSRLACDVAQPDPEPNWKTRS